MDLPARALLSNINNFCTFFFKDLKHAPEAPPHHYIIFPAGDGLSLTICIITSQIDSKIAYYKKTRPKAIESLVPVNENMLSFLKEESIIECNQAELITKEELMKRIDPDVPCELNAQPIPAELQKKINTAIIQSPLISPAIKQLIINRNR